LYKATFSLFLLSFWFNTPIRSDNLTEEIKESPVTIDKFYEGNNENLEFFWRFCTTLEQIRTTMVFTEDARVKLLKEIETFYYSTYNIKIIDGHNIGEPSKWIFFFNNKSDFVELGTDKLDNPTAFRDQYFQLFNYPAPRFDINTWDTFLKKLAERAQVIDITDYPENVEMTRQVCFCLWSMGANDNPEDLYCMYDNKDGFYSVPVKTIELVVKDLHLKISINLIKKILEKLQIKEEDEIDECSIRICDQNVKVWRLCPAKLEYSELIKWD
jgi:hypothetical protein